MWTMLLQWGVPAALTGFLFWWLQRSITKKEKQKEEREEHKEKQKAKREENIEKLMLMIMQTSRATNVLAEATARAVQRIPDAHCNGDMDGALERAAKIQKEEQEFLINQGIQNIFGE